MLPFHSLIIMTNKKKNKKLYLFRIEAVSKVGV